MEELRELLENKKYFGVENSNESWYNNCVEPKKINEGGIT